MKTTAERNGSHFLVWLLAAALVVTWAMPAGAWSRKPEKWEELQMMQAKMDHRLLGGLKRIFAGDSRIVDYVEHIEEIDEDLKGLRLVEGERAQRDAAKKIEGLDKKRARWAEKLVKRLERAKEDFSEDLEELKEDEADLEEKIVDREEKGRDANRYHREMDELRPQLDACQANLRAIDFLNDFAGTPEEEEEE